MAVERKPREVITGEEIEDYDFDITRLIPKDSYFGEGKYVTVTMKKSDWEREFDEKHPRAWGTFTRAYGGHVLGIEGEDEYRCLKLMGSGVMHSVLLGWIDKVEVDYP